MAILKIRGLDVLVDDCNVDKVLRYTWYVNPKGYLFTTYRVGGKRVTLGLNRLIFGRSNHQVIAYLNKNKLDNRRCNLVGRSYFENSQFAERKKWADCVYRFRKKWVVRFNYKAEFHYLGTFSSYDLALQASKKFRRTHK